MDEETRKAWMQLIGGTTMTQVALCRFLINEGVIDRASLVDWLEQKRDAWQKTAGPAGTVAVRALLLGIASEHEPEFPAVFH